MSLIFVFQSTQFRGVLNSYHGQTLNCETLFVTVRVKNLKEDGYFYRDELSA